LAHTEHTAMHDQKIWRKSMLPAFLDCLTTAMAFFVTVQAPVALVEMLTQSLTLITTAIMTTTYRKKLLTVQHWVAVAVATLSVFFTALSHALDTVDGFTSRASLLWLLILIPRAGLSAWGEILQVDTVSSGELLSQLGVWGLVLTLCLICPLAVFLPGDDHGQVESFPRLEILTQAKNYGLWLLVVGTGCLFLLTNITRLLVTANGGAVLQRLFAIIRTTIIWAASLALYYGFNGHFGEPWTSNSWIRLLGFALSGIALVVYALAPSLVPPAVPNSTSPLLGSTGPPAETLPEPVSKTL